MTIHQLTGDTHPMASQADDARADLPLLTARRREALAPRALPPAVRFASRPHRARTVRDAERARAIVLFVPCHDPGRLGAAIDADMEAVLASRGALPSSLTEDARPAEIVADQITRAAGLPVRGICICLPRLAPLCIDGVLNDDDARALSIWSEAARAERRLRLVVLLDDEDRQISLRVPVSLPTFLGESSVRFSPADASCDDDAAVEAAVTEPASIAPPDVPDLALPLGVTSARTSANDVDATPAAADDGARGEPPQFEADLELEIGVDDAPSAFEQRVMEALADPGPSQEELRAEARAEEEALELIVAEQQRVARLVHSATWRTYAMDLDAARGPKPASMVEKLYAQRYVPLIGAIARGETDAAVESVVAEWRTSFAESYEAGFGTVRATGRRPAMVMDAPEMAMRVARLASARSVKLILVDSMSYDLAERVGARIGNALSKRAVLVDKSVLWSGLPTTTPTQIHLLARGQEGLKDIPGPSSEPEVTRGRTLSSLRRERIGAREIFKLDVVEARLRHPGAAYDQRLDAIADEVADSLVKHFETFPARTLAYVFGDHGFTLGAGGKGWATGASSQGGASPEEVLVSGQGWLVDAVQ